MDNNFVQNDHSSIANIVQNDHVPIASVIINDHITMAKSNTKVQENAYVAILRRMLQ